MFYCVRPNKPFVWEADQWSQYEIERYIREMQAYIDCVALEADDAMTEVHQVIRDWSFVVSGRGEEPMRTFLDWLAGPHNDLFGAFVGAAIGYAIEPSWEAAALFGFVGFLLGGVVNRNDRERERKEVDTYGRVLTSEERLGEELRLRKFKEDLEKHYSSFDMGDWYEPTRDEETGKWTLKKRTDVDWEKFPPNLKKRGEKK